jgi:altronate hydrolase
VQIKLTGYLQISPEDSVIIALRPYHRGEEIVIGNQTVTVLEDIPSGHKIAAKAHSYGEDVVKFGYPIGAASQQIPAGAWVHTHNVKTKLNEVLEYEYKPDNVAAISGRAGKSAVTERTFLGYVRENGDVGVRNEIWILPTVGCINKTAELLAKQANAEFLGNGVEGIYHFAHPYGCSQLGDDLKYTQKILRGLALHPNAAGVLILGLGCENNYIDLFRRELGETNGNRIRFLNLQEEEDDMEVGMNMLEELVRYAKTFQREPVPVSKLKLGMKCGGSDGFSGITANPLIGSLSDVLVAQGGTSLLTEVPEMFGAETILMGRCANEEIFDKTVRLINDFKNYYLKYNQVIYENPSPGNKVGGITTLEEKSLGCVQKGGRSAVVDIIPYGGQASSSGLQLIEGPGNDLVSVTALIAAGAQIVLFSTGRGTPFGGPVPTVKISTNSEMARKKPNWIDFNAGLLFEGYSMSEMTQQLYDYVIELASGRKQTNNERNGFKEIAIFKDGVTL